MRYLLKKKYACIYKHDYNTRRLTNNANEDDPVTKPDLPNTRRTTTLHNSRIFKLNSIMFFFLLIFRRTSESVLKIRFKSDRLFMVIYRK